MRTISIADVIMRGQMMTWLKTQIRRKVNEFLTTVNYYKEDYMTIQDILLSTLEANVVYDDTATVKAREAEYNLVTKLRCYSKGTRLVNVGDVVTEKHVRAVIVIKRSIGKG